MLPDRLTPREIEILDLIKSGCGNKQVALNLGIAYQTVKQHLQLIYLRLGVANRTEAVIKALRLGYLQISNPEKQEGEVKMLRLLQAVYKPVVADPQFKERLLWRLLSEVGSKSKHFWLINQGRS